MATNEPGLGTLRAKAVAVTHHGRVREANEDSVGVGGWTLGGFEPAPFSVVFDVVEPIDFIVCDGMGGHRGGIEASRLALMTFSASNSGIAAAIVEASDALLARSEGDPALFGMGTTIVGLRVHPDGTAIVFNVGDSPAMRVADGYLGRLSVEDRPAVRTEANKGVVMQFLGGERRVHLEPHLHEFSLSDGDRIVLSSDGLTDVLETRQIATLLEQPAADAAVDLLAAVLTAGAPDNVSFIIVDIERTEPMQFTELIEVVEA